MGIRYKVVPLPTTVKIKKAGKTGEVVASFLEGVMNEQAKKGWRFVQVETMQAAEPAGCGVKNEFKINTQVLAVFSKQVDDSPRPYTEPDPQDLGEPKSKLNRGLP